jgi:hypothetical protein
MVTTVTYFDEESGEMMLDLPQEIVDELGFEPGDMVQWKVDENGCVSIVKYMDTPDHADNMVTTVIEKQRLTN